MPIDADDSVTSQRLQDDWFIVGGAAGAIATAGRAVLDYLLYRSGITDMQFPDLPVVPSWGSEMGHALALT